METQAPRLQRLLSKFNREKFTKLHEEMSFSEYIDLVYKRPKLARNAFQMIYDMIISKGCYKFERYRKELTHYKFFDNGVHPIYGLEETLDSIVNFIKGAAGGYGTERRVLLLHGPVGSSKSTIARCLKRGLESYSKEDDGALYTYKWVNLPTGQEGIYTKSEKLSPMHEDPLKLLPHEVRESLYKELNETLADQILNKEEGSNEVEEIDPEVYKLRYKEDEELNPLCRMFMKKLLDINNGDWQAVLDNHIRVVRMIYSESDRMGIATFQPKDEKNQDSTELTGDIDWSMLPHFGSDSDARSFSFDGEFSVAHRGMIEFIEMLKLQQEFLYDLLGATQENQIKPKKFPQIHINEFILAHSVSGNEPIIYREDGCVKWTTLEELYDIKNSSPYRIEVLAHNFDENKSSWTQVKNVTRHKWKGRLVKTVQKWGEVQTTPNHAIFDREGNIFMPEDMKEAMAVRYFNDDTKVISQVNLLDIIPKGFICDRSGSEALGHTKLPAYSRVRSVKQRAATSMLKELSGESLKAFIEFLVFFATEGHTTPEGVVISQKDRSVLEGIKERFSNIADCEGHIQFVQQDGCHRLIYNSFIMRDLAENLCGIGCVNKKLPDFMFSLSKENLNYVKELLKQTDGCCIEFDNCSKEYKDKSIHYKTTSPMLAAQVGYLLSKLGEDYSIGYSYTSSGKRAYGIRNVQGSRKKNTLCNLDYEENFNGWVYDIECLNIHNFACGVGQIVCHNTNNPEYVKLTSNDSMEALRDRTVKIDVPYLLRLSDEVKVLEQDYGKNKVSQHIAPHTLEIAALWAILTRLQNDKDGNLTLIQKSKLYNGEYLPGYTEDSVKELRDKYPTEGMHEGVSARYVQDKISNCLSKRRDYISAFMVMKEIQDGLEHSSLVTNKEEIAKYQTCVELVIEEYNEILKNEVRKALVGDEKSIERLCANYIDNLMAYINKKKIRNKITGRDEPPNERLMRSIETKIGVTDQMVDDFRRMIAAFIGDLAHQEKKFHWDSNPDLKRALEAKLFEDVKDHIKLSALNVSEASTVQPDLQDKIDAIKKRLIDQYGYNDKSATDVLEHVGSIFARGEMAEED